MEKSDTPIGHVTDTAFWVATYRAEESRRPDALFRDSLADRLTGELGKQIAGKMLGSRLVAWTVVIRTVVIDRYIQELVAQGVDTVINLGAGLDTRPYRMDLPRELNWVEIDYESTIRLKEERLKGETSRCRLKRIALDLADPAARARVFPELGKAARKALVITEGVVPYLSEAEVASLAGELLSQPSFRYWIVEYLDPRIYRFFTGKKRTRQMRNAPFRFLPADWYGTFERLGWKAETTRYLGEEGEKLGRKMASPWWAILFQPFLSAAKAREWKRVSGYIVLSPK